MKNFKHSFQVLFIPHARTLHTNTYTDAHMPMLSVRAECNVYIYFQLFCVYKLN